MARFRRTLLIALALLPLAVWGPSPQAAGTATRVVVPISQWRLSDGTIRYSVPVRVGSGPTVNAMLDTGSFGLRVMASAVAPTQYEPTALVRRYRFASGVVLQGVLAKAVVHVGGASTGDPVVIQVVQSVRCGPMRPNCPAARVDPDDYRFGGDGLPREGFRAILGLSLRAPDVSSPALNPLDFIGEQEWIVVLSRPGETAPGKLIINPNREDLAGFKMFPVSLGPAWDSPQDGRAIRELEMPGCIDSATTDQGGDCAPIPMDTGASNGLQPFFRYRVLYDQKHGLIGFRPRSQGTVSP